MWPGMAYYLTLFYPPSRTGKRIGQYFTAAQVSAAVVGLVSAGFQKMDGMQGLVGFQWMFLLYGVAGTLTGISLLWWLPERPLPPGEKPPPRWRLLRWIPRPRPVLKGRDAEIHYRDLKRVYHNPRWNMRDLAGVLMDWRLWPLTIMYFGVVGVGIGIQNYGTVIIRGSNPSLTGVQLSLLFAPIWIVCIHYPFFLLLSSVKRPHTQPATLSNKMLTPPTDGPHRHPHRHSLLRPLPSSPRHLLHRPRPLPNPRPAPDNLCRLSHELLATLRRSADCRLRPWSHRAHNHDMDKRALPTMPWRGGRRSRIRTGLRPGQLGEYPHHIRSVYWLGQ